MVNRGSGLVLTGNLGGQGGLERGPRVIVQLRHRLDGLQGLFLSSTILQVLCVGIYHMSLKQGLRERSLLFIVLEWLTVGHFPP